MAGSMSKLTKEQFEQFNRDGFLMVEGLFDAEEMDLLIRKCQNRQSSVWTSVVTGVSCGLPVPWAKTFTVPLSTATASLILWSSCWMERFTIITTKSCSRSLLWAEHGKGIKMMVTGTPMAVCFLT